MDGRDHTIHPRLQAMFKDLAFQARMMDLLERASAAGFSLEELLAAYQDNDEEQLRRLGV